MQQYGFALDVLEGEAGAVREAARAIDRTCDDRMRNAAREFIEQPIAQRGDVRASGGALGRRETQRRRQADGAGDVLRAGAAVPFLRAADDLRRERRAAAHVQRADTLRAVDLVRGDGEQVDVERIDAEVERARGLYSVGVDGDV